MKTGKTATRWLHERMAHGAAMEPDHEDREDEMALLGTLLRAPAAMEPDHEDREDLWDAIGPERVARVPQWSPIMKTGKTAALAVTATYTSGPQWSPIMKTGKTSGALLMRECAHGAAMEPDHEDREDGSASSGPTLLFRPQWSPIMKTGKTARRILPQ